MSLFKQGARVLSRGVSSAAARTGTHGITRHLYSGLLPNFSSAHEFINPYQRRHLSTVPEPNAAAGAGGPAKTKAKTIGLKLKGNIERAALKYPGYSNTLMESGKIFVEKMIDVLEKFKYNGTNDMTLHDAAIFLSKKKGEEVEAARTALKIHENQETLFHTAEGLYRNVNGLMLKWFRNNYDDAKKIQEGRFCKVIISALDGTLRSKKPNIPARHWSDGKGLDIEHGASIMSAKYILIAGTMNLYISDKYSPKQLSEIEMKLVDFMMNLVNKPEVCCLRSKNDNGIAGTMDAQIFTKGLSIAKAAEKAVDSTTKRDIYTTDSYIESQAGIGEYRPKVYKTREEWIAALTNAFTHYGTFAKNGLVAEIARAKSAGGDEKVLEGYTTALKHMSDAYGRIYLGEKMSGGSYDLSPNGALIESERPNAPLEDILSTLFTHVVNDVSAKDVPVIPNPREYLREHFMTDFTKSANIFMESFEKTPLLTLIEPIRLKGIHEEEELEGGYIRHRKTHKKSHKKSRTRKQRR